MKILIVGSDEIFSIENFYLKFFKATGNDVVQYTAQKKFKSYYYRSVFNKLIFKAGISSIYKDINSELLEIAEKYSPEVVLVFKGMELFPATLDTLRESGIKLANYNPDNPFLFTGKGSGNKNITRSIRHYDLHFTYSQAIQKQLKKAGEFQVAYLPFGYELPSEVQGEIKNTSECVRACFLGNPDAVRAKFILELADRGVVLDLYGHDWQRFVSHPNLNVFGPVYGIEQWKVLFQYRVQLNIMRVHNLDSHNMRTFEIPAIGGIQVAPDTPEHRDFFQDGKEIFLYRNAEDCAVTIIKLIELPQSEAEHIRRAAKARCINSGYSYESRAASVLEELKKLNRLS